MEEMSKKEMYEKRIGEYALEEGEEEELIRRDREDARLTAEPEFEKVRGIDSHSECYHITEYLNKNIPNIWKIRDDGHCGLGPISTEEDIIYRVGTDNKVKDEVAYRVVRGFDTTYHPWTIDRELVEKVIKTMVGESTGKGLVKKEIFELIREMVKEDQTHEKEVYEGVYKNKYSELYDPDPYHPQLTEEEEAQIELIKKYGESLK